MSASRPNRPLIVRCGYDSSTRRITFPSAATCKLESLRNRVEECFSLSQWPFYLAYVDDDGEEYPIKSEADLTEAIAYFVSGDDDHSIRTGSGSNGPGARLAYPAQKITMRVEVVVEYDGPSLSDTSSIASLSSSENSWVSGSRSGYTRSTASGSGSGSGAASFVSRDSVSRGAYSRDSQTYSTGSRLASSYTASVRDSALERTYSPGFPDPQPPQSPFTDSMAAMQLSQPPDFYIPSSAAGDRASRRPVLAPPSAASSQRLLRPVSAQSASSSPSALSPNSPISPSETAIPQKDTIPQPPPSLLTQSELGSRWLREQSQLASRVPQFRSVRRYDSDNESISDDEDIGDIALVRDERGRYYYSYQTTDASSLLSRDEFDSSSASTSRGRPLSRLSETSGATASPPRTPTETDQPHGPPILAPDCSACGIRLDYMRYVCTTCGEGDMWTLNAVKAPFVPRIGLGNGLSAAASDSDSEGTAWGVAHRSGSGSSSSDGQTVHNLRGRAESMSMSDAASNGSAASPTGGFRPDSGEVAGAEVFDAPRGYELCANCIEAHGIAHSKAAAKAARQRRTGHIRHAFREKIWSSEGWMDVDYAEDSECTICHGQMQRSRYKCVSCPKFDLCRSCYQKVQEIHPAHIFLALPDKPVARLPLIPPNGAVESVPVRHPGAFCHNCLQDIVGPRFHCAVCPSWDLCIQCEGVGATGDGSHTPDHIMMKIPVPLATNEVEAVSRRARDRWFQQDSSTVAAAPSSRSSSPTVDAETVYAGQRGSVRSATRPPSTPQTAGRTTPARGAPVVGIRDGLDHNARCANCNEWIMGRRFQCANCPSDPVPYNLCSICELRSYRVHDPRHVFFKFDRPVHVPLQSPRPLLPLLYRTRVGQVPATAVLNPRDPTAYLKHVLHKETLCDIHADQIRGIWLRCAHCAAGFDICSEAEQMSSHDPTHVFVVFKARVDMARFRELANLGGEQSRPLLQRQVYVS